MTEWKRVKIGDVCRIEKGTTGIAGATPGDYPLVVTALERKTCSTYQFDCEAVCIPLVSSSGHGKKSLKHVHYQSGKFALGTILAAVIPNDENELSARYLHQYLQFYKDTLIVPLMKGAANVSLAIRDIEKIEIPLPPIEKQNEFAKLFVNVQENDVEFQHEFETQKDLLKKLRQSILQDAIEGKLTEDWRKENLDGGRIPLAPAERGEPRPSFATPSAGVPPATPPKSRSTQKVLLPITEAEKPFEIPETWKWVRLGEIAENYDGNRIPIKRDNRKHGDFPYYGASGIIDYVSEYTHDGEFLLIGEDGANLKSRTTPVAFIANGKIWVNNHAHVLKFADEITLKYHTIYLNSVTLEPYITGGFQPKLSQKNLNGILVSLPPLAEQNEIVRRVETQLAKMEQLEQQVLKRESLTKSLFRGILRTAFEGE